ncbi:MAG: hypothetical protein ACFFER_14140 [Candidatus Thorarchaeota archaeon]
MEVSAIRINTPNGIPRYFSIERKLGKIVKVFRSGLVTEEPHRSVMAYIPENTVNDLPRSLYAHSTEDWIYWENAEIPATRRQRPPRLKYILVHPSLGRWYIEIVQNGRGQARKLREAREKIGYCQKVGCDFSGIIMIINNEQLIERMMLDTWPKDIAFSIKKD